MISSRTPQKTLHSSSTKARGSTKQSLGTTWGNGESSSFPCDLLLLSIFLSVSGFDCMCSDDGIKLQEIGSLDLQSGAATGGHTSKIDERTCVSYRG